jgi:hypothetical protein
LVIALLGAGIGQALAQSSNPTQPTMLTNDVAASATLVGDRAGSFAYFAIAYPGDLSVVTIQLTFSPSDPVTSLGVGFNVWAADGYFIGAGKHEPGAAPGVLELQYSDSTEENWLIQVFNYMPGETVSYSVLATGLPTPPTPTPIPVVTTTPTPPAPITVSVSGSLTGNGGGSYAFYTFPYAGDGSEVTISMTFLPDDPVIATGVNFIVYGPTGEVVRGLSVGPLNYLEAGFSSSIAGDYMIQVYDYIPGVTIFYTLVREGDS